MNSHYLDAVWVFKGPLNENICSDTVSKRRMQTVKQAIVLLYVSLLRRSKVSWGGGEIQTLPIQLIRKHPKVGKEVWQSLSHRDIWEICFLIRATIWKCFFSSSLLFRDVSVGGSVSCITDFPTKVDEAVYTVRLTAIFSPAPSLSSLSGCYREVNLEGSSSWILHQRLLYPLYGKYTQIRLMLYLE